MQLYKICIKDRDNQPKDNEIRLKYRQLPMAMKAINTKSYLEKKLVNMNFVSLNKQQKK
jgi:hypothetical protein